MTARYGTWVPLGFQTEDRMARHSIVCFHTMVGSLSGTESMFKEGGYDGTESHWGTDGAGTLHQWQDIAWTADANYDGNPEVISIENEDINSKYFPKWDTSGDHVPPFTSAQMARLIELGYRLALPGTHPDSLHISCSHSWECYTKGIPPVLIPDTRPGRRGFGYHAQGVKGNELVAGGTLWSKSTGKVCPGKARIAQIKSTIIPGIKARVEGKIMATLDADDKKWMLDNLGPQAIWWWDSIPQPARWASEKNPNWTPSTWLRSIGEWTLQNRDSLQALGSPATLAAAISAAIPHDGAPTTEQLEEALRKVLGSVDN